MTYAFEGQDAVISPQLVYYKDIIYIEKEKGAKYICYITAHGAYKERISLKN